MALFASLPSRSFKLVLTSVALWGFLASGAPAEGREWFGNGSGQPGKASIALAQLPAQGQETYERILQGGPFRHEKDGSVFGNRERLLPRQPRGHYREYTVDTPGSRDRGARRIVCGGARRAAPDACWYTPDHYASFRRIVP